MAGGARRLRPVWPIAALSLALGCALPAGAQQQPGPPPAGDSADGMPGAESGTLPMQTIEAAPDDAQAMMVPVLTVDENQLFAGSAWGRRMQARLEAEGGKIAAENDRLAAQLSEEEAMLTGQRAALPPAEFRKLAEAFDARATQVRRERAQAVQRLNDWADADRTAFYRAALPVMGEMMQRRHAVAVLDRRTVFVSLDAIDITADLMAELDRILGDGEGVVPLPDEAPAATPAPMPPAEDGAAEDGATEDGTTGNGAAQP